jgi:enoyl-CoA hydratase/carnithine racemase
MQHLKTMHVELEEGTAIVTLDRGVTNPINLELLNELAQTLDIVRLRSDVRSLALKSANDKFFSIGFDIPQLFDLQKADFLRFYRAFNQVCLDVYTLPKPTAAAITGHAIAGGCILTLCCDYRFIAEGRTLMGLNEIKLGVPVPYPADYILRYLIGLQHARDVMDSGEFHQPEKLFRMGMVDQVLPLEEVLLKSVEKVRSLGSLPTAAFAEIKRNRTETVEAQILARLEEKESIFVEAWYSDAARVRLKEAIERF